MKTKKVQSGAMTFKVSHKGTGDCEIKSGVLAVRETESRIELIEQISRGIPVSSVSYHKSLFDVERIG